MGVVKNVCKNARAKMIRSAFTGLENIPPAENEMVAVTIVPSVALAIQQV